MLIYDNCQSIIRHYYFHCLILSDTVFEFFRKKFFKQTFWRSQSSPMIITNALTIIIASVIILRTSRRRSWENNDFPMKKLTQSVI